MGRKLFAGGNTPLGFYSYYDNILDNSRAGRLIILKGGSGVGKGTFIKKVAEAVMSKGYDVDYYYCSGDSDSLDGAYCEALNLAIIDGTAPHMIDPKLPALVDEIVNLGVYINGDNVKEHSEEIIKGVSKKTECYKVAYELLRSAEAMLNIERYYLGKNILKTELDKVVSETINKYNHKDGVGKLRHMFGEAITPDGIIEFGEYECKNYNLVPLKAKNDYELNTFLSIVAEDLRKKGYKIELYHNPLFPLEIKRIRVVETNEYYYLDNSKENAIDLTEFIDYNEIDNITLINKNRIHISKIISSCINELSVAKDVHKNIEKYYVINMDWDGVSKLRTETIEKILENIEK